MYPLVVVTDATNTLLHHSTARTRPNEPSLAPRAMARCPRRRVRLQTRAPCAAAWRVRGGGENRTWGGTSSNPTNPHPPRVQRDPSRASTTRPPRDADTQAAGGEPRGPRCGAWGLVYAGVPSRRLVGPSACVWPPSPGRQRKPAGRGGSTPGPSRDGVQGAPRAARGGFWRELSAAVLRARFPCSTRGLHPPHPRDPACRLAAGAQTHLEAGGGQRGTQNWRRRLGESGSCGAPLFLVFRFPAPPRHGMAPFLPGGVSTRSFAAWRLGGGQLLREGTRRAGDAWAHGPMHASWLCRHLAAASRSSKARFRSTRSGLPPDE